MGDKTKGLYPKFEDPIRTDGKSAPGEKHDGCNYWIMDLDHDPFSKPALAAYSAACRSDGYELLADDIDKKLGFTGRMLTVEQVNGLVTTEKIDHTSYSCWRTRVGDTVISTDQSEMTALSFANGVRRGLRKALGYEK